MQRQNKISFNKMIWRAVKRPRACFMLFTQIFSGVARLSKTRNRFIESFFILLPIFFLTQPRFLKTCKGAIVRLLYPFTNIFSDASTPFKNAERCCCACFFLVIFCLTIFLSNGDRDFLQYVIYSIAFMLCFLVLPVVFVGYVFNSAVPLKNFA